MENHTHQHKHEHNNVKHDIHDKHDHHDHGHHHHDVTQLSGKKIAGVTILNAIVTITEIIGGLVSGSLALLSDAMHNLSDTLSIVISYVAFKIAQRPKNKNKTFGYKRIEILTASINALVLVVISTLLIKEAIDRFSHPQDIDTGWLLVVAVIGLLANLFSVFLLEKDSHHNLNIKSSYLHLMADTLSSVGVIIAGLFIYYFNIVWIDSVITLVIAIYIFKEAAKILLVTFDILMQASPKLDYDKIKEEIEKVEHVKNIHHVHAWRMDEKNIFFEAHIDFEDLPLSTLQQSLHKIEHILKEHHGIHHTTLQAECDVCHTKDMF